MGDQVEIEIGMVALSDYDEDDYLQVQTDSPGVDGSEGTQPAEALFPTGMSTRPLDPDKGDDGQIGLGSSVLIITFGDRRYAIPLGDPRDVAEGRVPKLRKGGRLYAGGAGEVRSFFHIDGEDPDGVQKPGSVMIAASYGTAASKKTLGLSFNVRKEGLEDITLLHGEGTRITLDKEGVTIASPGGTKYVGLTNDAITLAGKTKCNGSMTVGEQAAASDVALALPLIAVLTKLIGIVAAINAGTTGAPAAALTAELAAIKAKMLKAS